LNTAEIDVLKPSKEWTIKAGMVQYINIHPESGYLAVDADSLCPGSSQNE
jgi:hypothetical protein